MHYFVTGHTGFKGSWLILLLRELGHEVSGFSLPATEGGLFELAELEKDLKHHFIGDIRDLNALQDAVKVASPDFAIHMAAQPLVLRSYEDPIETYTTNVDGTINFLRAITDLDSPPISLVVTTDKVYRDDGKGSYVESDPLGGHDPYSASKAMADILTQSWAKTHVDMKLHVARAGNVIGAFDVSRDRLIPDAIRAIRQKQKLNVRYPNAVRPWQHVLDCLAGYYSLLQASFKDEMPPLAVNFGPDAASIGKVSQILKLIQDDYPDLDYEVTSGNGLLKETSLLTLDSGLAMKSLRWISQIPFREAVSLSLASLDDEEPRAVALGQVRAFVDRSPGLKSN